MIKPKMASSTLNASGYIQHQYKFGAQCAAMSRYTPRISVGYGCGTELRIELRTYIVIPILLAAKSSRNVERIGPAALSRNLSQS